MPFAEITSDVGPVRLEYEWVGAPASPRPVLVFLHEGLGSVAAWKDFPDALCRALGLRGLVYSRYGYGQSTPKPPAEHWDPRFMHTQAHEALPALLSSLGVERPWLFGHSDGGSIALLYAAKVPQAASGLIVVAPHIRVEGLSLRSIAAAREAYANTDLRLRLARYHADVDSAFRGWNDAWLDPAFADWSIEDELHRITCPVLAVQGVDDEYGTLEQVHGIARRVPQAQVLVLAQCGHSPHRDQPERLIGATASFIQSAASSAPKSPQRPA